MEFKTKQFRHQAETLDSIKELNYYALFWEMGTGKTKEAIDFIRYKCYQEKRVMRVLVICPKIALKNWENEFEMHSSMVKYVEILSGTKKKRLEKLGYSNKQIFIINFEGTVSIFKELIQHWDVIIVDESQRIKSPKAKQSKAIVQLGTYAKNRMILSGTPVLNSPMDIYNQYLFLDHGKTFGTNFYAFRNKYFSRFDIQSGTNGRAFTKYTLLKHLEDEMHKQIMSIADFRAKTDCLDLPEKVFQILRLEMSKDQAKAYNDMLVDLITLLKENPNFAVVASTAAVKIIRLRQISAGFVKLDDTQQEVRFKDNPKLKAVKEVLEELTPKHKVIIWACFRNNIFMLKVELKQYNPAWSFGDVKDKDAQRDKFNNDDSCRVIICEPKSSSTAINLIAASYAIYYSQGYNLEFRLQSMDRCHRSGSEIHDKITYIDLEFPNTVDTIIAKRLSGKNAMKESLIKQVEDIINVT